MIEWKPSMIFSDQNKGRTECIFFYSESPGYALRKTCFTGTQFTGEEKYITFSGEFSQLFTKTLCLFRTV